MSSSGPSGGPTTSEARGAQPAARTAAAASPSPARASPSLAEASLKAAAASSRADAASPAATTARTAADPEPASFPLFPAIAWACRRDLHLAAQSRAELALVMVFFLLVASLFPLSVSPDPGLLRAMASGIAWVAALLATLLGLPRLFASDWSDGTLEQIVLAPAPLPALIAGKVLAHWLVTGLPLVALAPLAGLQFGLPADAIGILVASLALGTPILSWLGAIAAALTLGARGGASLLALLVLPLAVPVLIFGAGSVESQVAGLGAEAHLSLLGAGLILSWVFGPFAAALAVKIAHE